MIKSQAYSIHLKLNISVPNHECYDLHVNESAFMINDTQFTPWQQDFEIQNATQLFGTLE